MLLSLFIYGNERNLYNLLLFMTDLEKKRLHTETIVNHISYVREMCDKLGIPELGKKHDLSKFSPEEFELYKYVTGDRSPHEVAREELGYSPYWCFHKNKNPHHWEHWLDSEDATPNGDGTFTMIVVPIKMPYKYVIEMFCDFIGAGKAYEKETWTPSTPLNYWNKACEGKRAMHKDSEKLIKTLLNKLSELNDLDAFVSWYIENKNNLESNY